MANYKIIIDNEENVGPLRATLHEPRPIKVRRLSQTHSAEMRRSPREAVRGRWGAVAVGSEAVFFFQFWLSVFENTMQWHANALQLLEPRGER